MRRVLLAIRAVEPINRVVAAILRWMLRIGRLAEGVSADWRLTGVRELEVQGARFRMQGRSDDRFLDTFYYGGAWEDAETRVFAMLASASEVVLDVGANTGTYALMTAALSPQTRIVAVEPSPANAARLRSNVALNPSARIDVAEAAVGRETGSITLTVPAGGRLSEVSSVHGDFSRAHPDVVDYEDVEVEQITIDELVRRHEIDRVDLIKLDVEYHELAALQGARETLERFSPVLLIEIFDFHVLSGNHPELRDALDPDNAGKVQQLLVDAGYTAFALGGRGMLRVAELGGIPDGGFNYLFVKSPPADLVYVPYREEATIRGLLS
jgi:FkbM family methyltransferase